MTLVMRKLVLAALALLCQLGVGYAASRFAICATTCTWDNSSTAMWSATTGGATGASAPVAADIVTLDANTCVGGTTCTITVNANLAMDRLTMGACTASTTGCILDFSANNNNITIGTLFSNTGSVTRGLNMGNGIWTINGSSTPWDQTTVTGLTFNANSSTLNFSPGTDSQNRTLILGAVNFATVNLNAAAGTKYPFTISSVGGNPTIATMGLSGSVFLQVQRTVANPVTVTNALNWVGTAANPFLIVGIQNGNPSGITTTNGGAITWATITNIAFAGGAVTATNSLGLNGNSGVTITNPTVGGGGACIGC